MTERQSNYFDFATGNRGTRQRRKGLQLLPVILPQKSKLFLGSCCWYGLIAHVHMPLEARMPRPMAMCQV